MMRDVEPDLGSEGTIAPDDVDGHSVEAEAVAAEPANATEATMPEMTSEEVEAGTTSGDRNDAGGDVPTSEPTVLRPVAGRHDRVRKISAIAFITTVLLGAAAVTLTRSPFFYARTIEVRGSSHATRADVLRIAAITPETNVFTLDARAAEERLERDPWIAGATITKDLPSSLVIDIQERFVVAVVESGGALRLVANDGALLGAASSGTVAAFPVIATIPEQDLRPAVGAVEPAADAVEGAARAIAAMVPTLRQRIDGVSILADGLLRVRLSSGAEVAYGEAVELSEKAMALRALLDHAAQEGASVISADVRVPSAPTAVLAGGG